MAAATHHEIRFFIAAMPSFLAHRGGCFGNRLNSGGIDNRHAETVSRIGLLPCLIQAEAESQHHNAKRNSALNIHHQRHPSLFVSSTLIYTCNSSEQCHP
jgi:hypothetical protein